MKKSDLTKWCKNWSIKDIVDNIFGNGMEFMARKEKKSNDATAYKEIMVKEIKSRKSMRGMWRNMKMIIIKL